MHYAAEMKGTREKRPRSKTFLGCWTCRDRKVKCDAVRPECDRCRKSSLRCRGYDVELYWVTDEDTVPASAIRRKAMALQGFKSWPFQLDEVDRQIAAIDDYDEADLIRAPTATGPFTVFQSQDSPTELYSQVQSDRQDDILRCIMETKHSSLLESESKSPDKFLDGIASVQSLVKSSGQCQVVSLPGGAVPPILSLMPIMFGGSPIHHLMDNYVRNVASVLPPLPHPANPYSSIYAPEAMKGASSVLSGISVTTSEIPLCNVAIFYALLATSAFHLRGPNPKHRSELDVTARRFRAKAFASLQKALQGPCPTRGPQALSYRLSSSSYLEAVISAMLTLVTMDVMEGSMSEYWIHLRGIHRLARQSLDSTDYTPKMRQLISISSFLSTLANTTSISVSLVPWSGKPDSEPDFAHQRFEVPYGLETAYGITPSLAAFMKQAVVLNQHISYYSVHSRPLPPSLTSACMALSDALSEWSIDAEPLSNFFPGTNTKFDLLLAKHHIRAFAHGLRVYYHTRVLPCSTAEMNVYIDRVASELINIQDLKTVAGYESNVAATITWPGFIASCEAESGSPRNIWYRWWTDMLKHRIGNIARLWRIVQEAWRLKDEEGYTEVPAWMPVLRKSGERVLAV